MATLIRPGQMEPNDFELAILNRLTDKEPSIRESLERLHVLSRGFTGVGSFTKFKCDDSAAGTTDRQVGLDDLIIMPGVSHGLGAVLFLKRGQPECLEVYTFDDEHWDGVYDGFSIQRTA